MGCEITLHKFATFTFECPIISLPPCKTLEFKMLKLVPITTWLFENDDSAPATFYRRKIFVSGRSGFESRWGRSLFFGLQLFSCLRYRNVLYLFGKPKWSVMSVGCHNWKILAFGFSITKCCSAGVIILKNSSTNWYKLYILFFWLLCSKLRETELKCPKRCLKSL